MQSNQISITLVSALHLLQLGCSYTPSVARPSVSTPFEPVPAACICQIGVLQASARQDNNVISSTPRSSAEQNRGI